MASYSTPTKLTVLCLFSVATVPPLPHHRGPSPVFVIPAETLKVHSGCSSKTSAYEQSEKVKKGDVRGKRKRREQKRCDGYPGRQATTSSGDVILICSISTTTSPGSALIIISVLLTHTEDTWLQRARNEKPISLLLEIKIICFDVKHGLHKQQYKWKMQILIMWDSTRARTT